MDVGTNYLRVSWRLCKSRGLVYSPSNCLCFRVVLSTRVSNSWLLWQIVTDLDDSCFKYTSEVSGIRYGYNRYEQRGLFKTQSWIKFLSISISEGMRQVGSFMEMRLGSPCVTWALLLLCLALGRGIHKTHGEKKAFWWINLNASWLWMQHSREQLSWDLYC